jgi:hypothetical protein
VAEEDTRVSTSSMIPSSLAKKIWWVVDGEAIPNHDCKVKITLDKIIPVTTEQQNKPEITHLLENTTYTLVFMIKRMYLVWTHARRILLMKQLLQIKKTVN